MKKKIGFIDLFIDEWHANNYPQWIRESALKDEFEVAMAWEKYTPEGKKDLKQWCAEQNVTPASSIAEVVEKCDCICVLAPSNPEVHEELAELPEPPIAPRNYGAISAWAWGLSRMMDVLEDIPEIDTEKAAVLGHSRLGKTALWAGVNDERFKLVISNNSGCMGAAPSCRVYGERPGHLAYIQRFWFSDKFIEYAEREDTLPVDQHQLLALIAPRTVYVASSSEDYGADPYGEFLSAKEAAGIWALYGRENDFPDSFPELNKSVGSSVKYHCKTGGHSITAADWQHYYECADKLFKQQ
jgi:hypothetical protein